MYNVKYIERFGLFVRLSKVWDVGSFEQNDQITIIVTAFNVLVAFMLQNIYYGTST